MIEVVLPLTGTGRKYGYIMWSRSQDESVRGLTGSNEFIALVLPSGLQKHQRVDWRHRRISLGYSLTRALPETIARIELRANTPGLVEVVFL